MQKIGTKITVTVPDDVLKEIENLSTRLEMSKAEVSRRMLELGLDVYKTYKPTGIPKLAEIVRRYKKRKMETNSSSD
jgi:metal-responsive CopG/Arc/MetJ family transcriptional regulator